MVTTTTGLATSFITFTRTSNATVTDSNGFIEWAGHNLLTNSESFDASAWTPVNASIAANAVSAPNSTTTADTLTALGSLASVRQAYNSITAQLVAGFFVKAGTATTAAITVMSSSNGYAVTFDLSAISAGSAVIQGTGGTVTNMTGAITAVGGNWFLCTVTYNEAGVGNVYLGTSATSGTIHIWGAHLYRSDLGGMVLNPARGDAYYPTTVRNMIGYTEDFSNAYWTKSNIATFGSGSISNAIVAPNGLQTADKIVASTASGYHNVYTGVVTTTAPYVFSFYAKAAEYSLVRAANASASSWYASFNLANGTVVAGTTGGSGYISSAIQPVGTDGWYRCSVVFSNVTSLATSIIGYPSGATLDPYGATYTGDGVSGTYFWGAQLSDSASLDTYSPVYGAAVTSAAYYAPRLDYDPVTLAARGLLVEEQRTNLLQWSSDFRDTTDAGAARPWIYNNVTVTPNDAVAPDGTMTADRINPSSSAAIYYQLTSPASATTWTFSIWLKSATGSSFSMPYYVNGSGADPTPQTGTLGTVTTQWQRFSVQVTTASSAATVNIALGNYSTGWASGNNVHAWGAQIDSVTGGNATFPTSYIPTNGATATRTADVASVSTQAFPYSASTQSVVVSYQTFENSNSGGVFSINNGGDTNRLDFRTSGSVVATASGANQLTGVDLTIGAAGTINKAGFALAVNDFADVANGGTVKTDTTVTLPAAATIFNLGYLDNHPSAYRLNGHIRQITYIPRRLSNSELQARTV